MVPVCMYNSLTTFTYRFLDSSIETSFCTTTLSKKLFLHRKGVGQEHCWFIRFVLPLCQTDFVFIILGQLFGIS